MGLTGVVLANSVSFLVAAVLLGAIAASGAVAAAGDISEAAGRRWRRVWSELHDGLAVVRRSRPVGVVFGVTSITAFGEGVFAVMFAVWVRDVLEGGVPALGLLQTSQAIGGLLGGVVGVYAGRYLAPERLYGVALLTFGILDLALFNFPLVLDGLWIGSALMILVGIPATSTQSARATIMQTNVDDAYLGRVFGSLGTSSSLLDVRRHPDRGRDRRHPRPDRAAQLPGRRVRRRGRVRAADARLEPGSAPRPGVGDDELSERW